MCGRFTMKMSAVEAEKFYGFPELQDKRPTPTMPRFNIAPSQDVLVIVEQEGKRVLTTMRWGFAPPWWQGNRPPPINARAETITERPTFRGSYKSKRCLIPADGFYEWVAKPGRKKKQPMHLHLPDDAPFSFAGIWTPDADGELTCAIVTTAANAVVQPIHTRMPVILDPDLVDLWLDPDAPDPAPCVASTLAEQLEIYPVSDLVSSASHQGPELVEPLE